MALVLGMVRQSDPDAQMGPLMRLAAGAGAGIIAMSATYPLDMIRGRLTVQVGAPRVPVHIMRVT
jgi:solute carrier family 25 phosphate transporter 23/24/25/41